MSDFTAAEKAQILAAPAWKPTEAGETLSGKVAHCYLTERSNEFGDVTYPVVVINTTDGLVALHAVGKVLRNRAYELKPRRDEEHTIVFKGRVTPAKGGNAYGDYTWVGPKDDLPEVSWDE